MWNSWSIDEPAESFAVSKACRESGENVYPEKPLAMSFREAQQIVELAEQKRTLHCFCAVPSAGGNSADVVEGASGKSVGTVHAVYAEMDGGLKYRSTT